MPKTYHPKRKTHLTRHHLIPKSRGGTYAARNILRLWRDSHNFWHQIFTDYTLDEIIVSLDRRPFIYDTSGRAWVQLFKERTPYDVRDILVRIARIKKTL